ncbi:MAG TPA: ribosome small subunit-dependent GTPase A [Peptococcaceae bacterium]|nr:ribosome small subunit-dependent GTPase A [Peptococcaceae bacterium]HPZ71786.1 ribosome small subunit-dependent GTPase A [Peptococcaceae bacterium]HQD53274.1 ribosome small subunit-dependent GTPase A [Peptococcaceae bacterium]
MSVKQGQIEGIVMKAYSGFYYVLDEKQQLWECSLRGKYRLKGQSFLPGDRVIGTVIDEVARKAVIEEVLPRHTIIDRPLVANVDQVIIVMALANPEPDLHLLDRMIIMVQSHKVSPALCFNKADLVEEQAALSLQKCYAPTGFPFLITSTVQGLGIARLKELLKGKITVFAGPSGVGKSSLLNLLQEEQQLQTGEVSVKLARGRHTTRHAQLLANSEGGLLVDTPGFSRLNLPEELRREEVTNYYPDYGEYAPKCRFRSCLHRAEPDCAVQQAVEKGLLDKGRYQRYLDILTEVMEAERRY